MNEDEAKQMAKQIDKEREAGMYDDQLPPEDGAPAPEDGAPPQDQGQQEPPPEQTAEESLRIINKNKPQRRV